MQQAMVSHSKKGFEDELNEHLRNGWRIVPGTMWAGTQRLAAQDFTPDRFRLPDGTTISTVFFVVIENDE
jgi:hypothetical protein